MVTPTIPSQGDWIDSKKRIGLPNGVQLAYIEIGDSSGEPLLMIHGYTDNSRGWSLIIPHHSGRRILAIDLRGHGQSTVTDTYSLEELAGDAALFIDALGLGKVDVIGHSLGSMTTQVLAAYHPEKVKSIILVNSALGIIGQIGDSLRKSMTDLSHPIDPDGLFMKEWLWNPSPVDPEFLRHAAIDIANTDRRAWEGVMHALNTTDLAPIQSLIAARMLIVWGDIDPLFDLASQLALRNAHPEAEQFTFVGAGHNPHWEHPKEASEIFLKFLAG